MYIFSPGNNSDVDKNLRHQWLWSTDLNSETKEFILATQNKKTTNIILSVTAFKEMKQIQNIAFEEMVNNYESF